MVHGFLHPSVFLEISVSVLFEANFERIQECKHNTGDLQQPQAREHREGGAIHPISTHASSRAACLEFQALPEVIHKEIVRVLMRMYDGRQQFAWPSGIGSFDSLIVGVSRGKAIRGSKSRNSERIFML